MIHFATRNQESMLVFMPAEFEYGIKRSKYLFGCGKVCR